MAQPTFCPSCGRTFSVAAPLASGGRVIRHVRTLGILWLVYSGLHLLQSVAFTTFFSNDWFFGRMPFFVPGFVRAIGGFFTLASLVGLLAGWGLLERRPWARTLVIVLGVLSLFKFPLGTALGIYTLWTLAPSQSEMEYRSVQRV